MHFVRSIFWLLLALAAHACSLTGQHYVAPTRGADLRDLVAPPDDDRPDTTSIAPAPGATWPATIVTVRVRARLPRSWHADETPRATWEVVGVRDLEGPEALARVRALAEVRDVAAAGSLSFPSTLGGTDDLMEGAARLGADLLLVSTVDTRVAQGDDAPFLTLVTLGLAPTHVELVTSTAQCVVLDARTGFVYASAEATVSDEERGGALLDDWDSDRRRLAVERRAFEKLVGELEAAWPRVLEVAKPSS